MDTLKDQLRRALDADQPGAATWVEHEERLLAAVEKRRSPSLWWAVGPTLMAAAVGGWLVCLPGAQPSPPVRLADTTDIYLRTSSEPESTALHISITTYPGRTP